MKIKQPNKKVYFVPGPKKVLIKISQKEWEQLFYKWIEREDGTRVKLFTDIEESEGFDRRYSQNVSVGKVVAVGSEVKNIYPNDFVILDYLVSNNVDDLIGYVNGDRLVSVVAKTTYHDKDSKPFQDGRKAFVKGDIETISPVLGVVRHSKAISFHPYCFLVNKSNLIISVGPTGKLIKEVETISEREILSAPEDTGYSDGDRILLKELDMFSRFIEGKEISVCMVNDILCKKVLIAE